MLKAMIHKMLIQVQICLLLAGASVLAVCNDTCGNVSITYPFGIGANCFFDPWFEIECTNSKPYLSKLGLEFAELDSDFIKVRIPPLNVCSTDAQSQQIRNVDLRGSPFKFPPDLHFLIMEGCSGSAMLLNQTNEVIAGCSTVCSSNKSNKSLIPTNSCYGVHCCQIQFPAPDISLGHLYQFFQIYLNRQTSGEGQNCIVATIVWNSLGESLSSSDLYSLEPARLYWTWPNSVHEPRSHRHATCSGDGDSLYCYCDQNYQGSPYLSDGCKAPKGCEECRGYCLQHFNGTGYYCEHGPLLNLAAILGLSNSFGMLVLVGCLYWLYRFLKRRRKMKRSAKFFKRNGGLLLQQQLSSNEGIVERTKIFTISEMSKATNNFDENRILGQGGQGTVYKGMLTDGSIVAVKKSKLLDESQLEQFINEVVILSRVNHRNVVKLFGCCLETEVPLLVYEFIPNGTLYKHIHDPDEEFVISWEMRLKIAADSAGAIAYLHSSSSIPIYHRDIKSSNILLDERHRAKVSDFGSSKTIAIDQTHLTTLVQGTVGYLDPEYFRSYQFTEKSDVYSFGVVLLELLTTKKPIFRDASTIEQKNLVTEFQDLAHNSRLSEILDPEIVKQAKEDELISVVELAKRCVSWSGKMRPTMKEVAMTLERIMKSPAQVSAWYQQQEAIPIQYAAYDDFDMTDISGEEFTSITLPVGSSSPPYTDEYPLLPDLRSSD